MGTVTEKIIYVLSCQHRVLASAFYVNGPLRCPICRERNSISDIEVMEWRANCRHCKYARWAGMSEETATIFADGHVGRNPKHMVSVNREKHLAASKTKEKLDAWRILSQS
jgi:hypothetical protein